MYIQRLKCDCKLLDVPIAHKGVFGNNILENSFEAIKAAIDMNIPFEIDIVQTKDNIPIIYHDFTITIDGIVYNISELTLKQIKRFVPKKRAIMTLAECISLNNGKVPMVLDFKETSFFKLNEYRKNLITLLQNYPGEYAIQSFNPFFICTVGKHLPNAISGQLICRGKTLIDTFSPKHPKLSSNTYEKLMSTICYIARADYIGLEISKSQKWRTKIQKFIFDTTDEVQNTVLEITSKVTKRPIIGWTLSDLSELDIAPEIFDNYVFEPDAFENYIDFYEKIKIAIQARKMRN